MVEKTLKKRSKLKRIVLVVAVIVLLICVAVVLTFNNIAKSMGIGTNTVADYETRVEIWENAAGNNSSSKLDDMNVDYNSHEFLSYISFAKGIVGTEFRDEEKTLDTFTYLHEIKNGYEKETYEDIPYLIPYLVEDAEAAVIVIPGGGYGYKSMDGTESASKDVALALNEQGISAFLLHYRSNPYEYPIPLLDVQRAVRYIRYHADDYGIDPSSIGLIGFSAGGYEVGGYINLVMGEDMFPDDYMKDEIDDTDDRVFAAGMIYPVLSYRNNVPMLFCSFDDEAVRNDDEREKLLDMTDLSLHFTSEEIPQFIAYGTADTIVGMEGVKSYIASGEEANANIFIAVAEDQEHGFGMEYYMNDFLDWIKEIQR